MAKRNEALQDQALLFRQVIDEFFPCVKFFYPYRSWMQQILMKKYLDREELLIICISGNIGRHCTIKFK